MNRLFALLAFFAATVAQASGPPQDYPFRVRAIRLVQNPWSTYTDGTGLNGAPDVGGSDTPTGKGYAVIFDQNGALKALQFKYSGDSCFYRPKDLFFQVGGFYPARWRNDHEIAIVTDINNSGKIHECNFKVRQLPIPATPDYLPWTAETPAKMAKIYAHTSVANPPARPAPPKRGIVVYNRTPLIPQR